MYRSIQFASTMKFLGRNGMFSAQGMTMVAIESVVNNVPTISIAPVTTKGAEGRCWIEFPVSDIPVVIGALQALSDEIKRNGGVRENAKGDNA